MKQKMSSGYQPSSGGLRSAIIPQGYHAYSLTPHKQDGHARRLMTAAASLVGCTARTFHAPKARTILRF